MKESSNPKARPAIREGAHPVETTRYIITTPPIINLCKHVVSWVRRRLPGGIVYAPPRHGKTSALEVIRCELREQFKQTTVINLPAWNYDVPSEKKLFQDLLEASEHANPFKGDPSDLRRRLINWWIQLGQASEFNLLVLLIDEAQCLHEKHYKWLIGVHNALKQHGLHLIVILMGQSELLSVRAGYILTKKKQIVGRFMVHEVEFTGLKSVEDLEHCLQFYDGDARFPTDSDWTFTRYYRTAWFDGGGRLKQLAKIFAQQFRECQSLGKGIIDREIPMQYFCRTVEHFLQHAPESCFGDDNALGVNIRSAIVQSGYLDVLMVDWSPTPKRAK